MLRSGVLFLDLLLTGLSVFRPRCLVGVGDLYLPDIADSARSLGERFCGCLELLIGSRGL